jgi:choline kinase
MGGQVHIIPAAGLATRMGGLPKFLLPVGSSGKPLLRSHLEMSHSANLEAVVMLHPRLFEFGKELIGSWNFPNVRVFSVESPTMTKTVKEAIRLSKTQETIFSISMPDTFFSNPDSFKGSFLLDLRKKAPSLALWRIREDQAGKLGQVLISRDSSFVLDMIDKDPNCGYRHIWGMMALHRELIEKFNESNSHPGISLGEYLKSGLKISWVETVGDYLDCGTPTEYYRAFADNLGT